MSPSQLSTAIKACYDLRLPLFIWGAPGIGKSDVVRRAAADMKIELVDKRLGQSDPTELKGMPWPDQAKKVMKFFQDSQLPTKGKGILFLDELSHAPNAVQAVAFQLVLDRRLGDYELPAGWHVVAAGNRMTDRAGAQTMNAALDNRFTHVEMKVSNQDWHDWAQRNGISPLTTGFMRYRPEHLCIDKIEPGARAFHTPRAWAKADAIMQSNLPDEVARELIYGTVGEGVGNEYIGYCRSHASLVSIDRILADPEHAPLPVGAAPTYAVVSLLERQVNVSNIAHLHKYIKRLTPEFQMVYMEAITRVDPDLQNTKTYIDWLMTNREAVLG